MIFLGLDPGLTGALAFLEYSKEGNLVGVGVYDTPTLTIVKGKTPCLEYDIPGMAGCLSQFAKDDTHVIIENAQAMPKQGVKSTWTTGYGFGIWLGIVAAFHLPYTRVSPRVWKKALSLNSDKETSRLRAQQLFPTADLRLRKHHHRSEALLLAWYGYTSLLQRG